MAQRHPSCPPVVFKNLGVAYQGLSASRPDAPAAMVRAWKRYLSMAPANDPDVAKIRQAGEETAPPLATRPPRYPEPPVRCVAAGLVAPGSRPMARGLRHPFDPCALLRSARV